MSEVTDGKQRTQIEVEQLVRLLTLKDRAASYVLFIFILYKRGDPFSFSMIYWAGCFFFNDKNLRVAITPNKRSSKDMRSHS